MSHRSRQNEGRPLFTPTHARFVDLIRRSYLYLAQPDPGKASGEDIYQTYKPLCSIALANALSVVFSHKLFSANQYPSFPIDLPLQYPDFTNALAA